MNIEELKKEYASQDNRCTAYPIYVMVQERFCVGVMKDGYSPSCPYGDSEKEIVFTHKDFETYFETKEELNEVFEECYGEKINPDDVEELTLGYIWVPVEFFLTIKGAKEYMKANAHNHGKLRTYVSHFERRNFEMNLFLEELGFKVQ